MAINRGPNIVQDGLVFGYDTDDRSSRFYKGEPTINYAQYEMYCYAPYYTYSKNNDIVYFYRQYNSNSKSMPKQFISHIESFSHFINHYNLSFILSFP